MKSNNGYLVIYIQVKKPRVSLLDKDFYHLSNLDPLSGDISKYVENALTVTNLQEEKWQSVLGPLSLQEKMDGLAFSLAKQKKLSLVNPLNIASTELHKPTPLFSKAAWSEIVLNSYQTILTAI